MRRIVHSAVAVAFGSLFGGLAPNPFGSRKCRRLAAGNAGQGTACRGDL